MLLDKEKKIKKKLKKNQKNGKGSHKKIKIFCGIIVIGALLAAFCYSILETGLLFGNYKKSFKFTSHYLFSGDHNREDILYVSRHIGTKSNFWYVADKLNYNVDVLTPSYDFNDRPKCFDNGSCGSYIENICKQYNYVVISDTIPDANPFLVNRCTSKIILEITNRFDLFLPKDKRKNYIKRFGKAINENKNIIVVANNPYENFYACERGIFIPKYYLIRPTGYSSPELIKKIAKDKNKRHSDLAVINRTIDDKWFTKSELNKRKIKFDLLGQHYGGPLALAEYKATLLLPYQVSIMKIMENFRYGVAMLIPSESLFRKMAKKFMYLFPAKELLKIPDGLRLYTEWYNDEFKDLFIYFDSWDDIPKIMETVDFEKVKAKGIEFMKNYEKEIINKWKQVFGKEEERDAIIDKKPICKNSFYNYP